MRTLLQLKRQLQGTTDLQTVVKAMKALAAANIYQYQEAVSSLEDYFFTLETGLQILFNSPMPGEPSRTFFQARILPTIHPSRKRDTAGVGIVLFGAEQGMSGHFNREIIEYAIRYLRDRNIAPEQAIVQPVGSRLPTVLESSPFNVQQPDQPVSMPNAPEEIAERVEQVAVEVNGWYRSENISHIILFHHKPKSNAGYDPVAVQLAPLNPAWLDDLAHRPWPNRQVPSYTIPADRLFSDLIRQFLFISLYRAFAESLASENASRLAAMQVAEKKISERLSQLQGMFYQERQVQITEEVLNLAAGYETLKQKR